MWQVLILNLGEWHVGIHYTFSCPVALIFFRKKFGKSIFKRTLLRSSFSNSKIGIIELVLSMP